MDLFKFGTSEYATPVGILIKAGTDPSLIQPGATDITLLVLLDSFLIDQNTYLIGLDSLCPVLSVLCLVN